MKGLISIVKYYPDTNRDEGFGIGLILISEDAQLSLTKISTERLKRINSAYGIKKSSLIDMAIEEISAKSHSKESLDYNIVYENGNIRYSKLQIIDSDDLPNKFNELYLKFVADYYEESFENFSVSKRDIPARLGEKLRNKLESNNLINGKLNIGYNFKDNPIGDFLIGSAKIDFIGVNCSIYAGEIINLDLTEESLQKSIYKTLALFEAFEKSFPNRFSAQECKMLVLEEQARNPEKAVYMDSLNTWKNKVGYTLVIKPSLDEFQRQIQNDVESKKIIRYDQWLNSSVNVFS